jgi:single-stranded-DNA-specific exonuclease
LKAFKEKLQTDYINNDYPVTFEDSEILGELHFKDISFELTSLVKRYEPYGQENPAPKFISRGVEILQVDRIGKEGEHLRFSFFQDGISLQGLKFKSEEVFQVGERVDIVYSVKENFFRGQTTLQLFVSDIIKSDEVS